MQERTRANTTISGRERVAEGADLRVSILTLGEGESIPWHYHSETSDDMVCMEGVVVVETRAPRAVHELRPGERCTVAPKTAHYVHGKDGGGCRFLIVQGVGIYDWMPVG